ncbi:MAG TPA: hypothetical protein PLH19_16405 [Anaerolineae bacterium]|nr:hypothetical protein [Anaerolineae bacterium]
MTTYYVGTHFAWTGSTGTVIKYYYAGSQRVAMRKGNPGTLSFLLGDHLGSTSVTADSAGGKVAKWRNCVILRGEERFQPRLKPSVESTRPYGPAAQPPSGGFVR